MSVILRVRLGKTHGVQKLQGGESFTVSEDEATLLLAAFSDKLERVSEPDSPALDISEKTPADAATKPSRLRHRKPEDM